MEALALVDFLIADSNHPARWWLAGLLPAGDLTIYWPLSVRRKDFTARWLAHIYEQTGYALSTSAPDSSLVIDAICHEAEGQIYYRYDVGTAVWTKIATVPPLGNDTQLWPLPGHEGYLAFQEIRSRFEIESRMTLHYEGVDYILMRLVEPMLRPVPYYRFTSQADPTGRYLLLFDPGPSRYHLRYFLLDFMNCDQGLCPMQVLFGRPVWSPDGRQMMLAERPSPDDNADLQLQLQQLSLWRGAGNGQNLTVVARGYNPHWLDNERYLYMRLNEIGLPEVVQAATADDVPHLWLETADLLATMPLTGRPSTLTIADIAIHSPQQVAILATDESHETTTSYLFLWQLTAMPTLVYQSDSPLTMSFAPDGRWLTLTEPEGNVTLIHTSNGTQQKYHSPNITPDWTADGQWLLTGRENYILLTMPENGYQALVVNDKPSCQQISWAE